MPFDLCTEITALATKARDLGYHNEADYLDDLVPTLSKIAFHSPTYSKFTALEDTHDHLVHCDCKRCPHCDEVIEDY